MLGDKWSIKYKKCRKCGTISTPHGQHGYCKQCWNAVVHKKYKKYYQNYYQRYWKKNKEKIMVKRNEKKVLCQTNTLSSLKENPLP